MEETGLVPLAAVAYGLTCREAQISRLHFLGGQIDSRMLAWQLSRMSVAGTGLLRLSAHRTHPCAKSRGAACQHV